MKVYLHYERIRIGFCINMFFSVRVDEDSDLVYDKINRRLEHLTSLKTNSRIRESEHMLVISIYFPLPTIYEIYFIFERYTLRNTNDIEKFMYCQIFSVVITALEEVIGHIWISKKRAMVELRH